MTKHKKKILIISIVSATVLIATVFLVLALTIWRTKPKTTQDWLNDFKNSLEYNTENLNQKTEKRISILDGETEVASFYQLVEIKEQESGTVAHILIKEIYPTLESDEFDVLDEYYYIDGIMYMYRKTGGEEVTSSFASTWEVFWEIANENAGSAEYNFTEGLFEALETLHEEDTHKMSAVIPENNKVAFFGADINTDEILNITLNMTINQNLSLNSFKLNYMTNEEQSVKIEILASQPEEIILADWMSQN